MSTASYRGVVKGNTVVLDEGVELPDGTGGKRGAALATQLVTAFAPERSQDATGCQSGSRAEAGRGRRKCLRIISF